MSSTPPPTGASAPIAWAQQLDLLSRSPAVRASGVNAAYNVADYLAQPILMLAAAPFLVGRLGLEQYGVWMLVMALAGGFGVIGLGFSEATVRYVSKHLSTGEREAAAKVIQVSLAANALLTLIPALALLLTASLLVEQVFRIPAGLQGASVRAVQAGALLLFLRSIEFTLASVLRACERYDLAVRASVLVKVLSVSAAVVLAAAGWGVTAIVAASAVAATVGVLLQALSVRTVLPGTSLRPSFDAQTWSEIWGFGAFAWLQCLGSTLVSYADRLLIGIMLGAAPVAYYTICIQLAQPIHGLNAAAFNFMFPRLSALRGQADLQRSRRAYRLALVASIVVAVLTCLPLLLFGPRILGIWMGTEFAQESSEILFFLILAFGILSVSVVPHFALMAAGKSRFLAAVNAAGGVLSIIGALILLPVFGAAGAAISRTLHGLVVSLNFAEARRNV